MHSIPVLQNRLSIQLHLNAQKRLFFWVLNKVQTGNLKNEHTIPSVKNDINAAKIALSDILAVDCSLDEEVENNMITPILEKLSSNMSIVDDMLISQANSYASDVSKAIEDALNTLDNIEADAESGTFEARAEDIDKVYDKDMMRDFRDKISDEYEKRRDNTQKENFDFVNKCEEILRRMLLILPTEEKIVQFLDTGSSGEHGDLGLQYFGDNLRMDILNIFSTLDETLDCMVNELKEKTVNIMIKEGRFGNIVPRDAVKSKNWAEQWLKKFLEKIKAKSKYPTIYHTFTEFKDFTFHVDGFMIYKIRRELEPLNYHNKPITLHHSNKPDERPALAHEICQILEYDLETVYDKIRISIKKLYNEPDCALWAAANAMYQRSYELIDKKTGLKPLYEWHDLYRKWSSVIWRDKYLKTEGNNETIRAWNEIVSQLREYTREGFFEIGKEV